MHFLQADIKEWQTQLLEQLLGCIQRTPGPPVRRLIGRCLAALFSVGDTFMLFDTVNKCNDLLKNRDDSPTYLPTRLLVLKNNITLLGGYVLKYFFLQSGNLLSGVHV
jgi:HEAT repeat-containing protein 5